jgi:hypothetical protein
MKQSIHDAEIYNLDSRTWANLREIEEAHDAEQDALAEDAGEILDPFKKSFAAEYETARAIGDIRFCSECKHENIRNGRCAKCLRKVK